MIELIVMALLWRYLSNAAQDRGRSRGWGWLGPGAWVTGELLGAIIGLAAARSDGVVYGMALTGAVMGAGLAVWIVLRMKPMEPAVDAAVFD